MIEVKIRDTKSNMGKTLTRSKESILSSNSSTKIFLYDAYYIIVKFLQELEDIAKEDKKCQTGL